MASPCVTDLKTTFALAQYAPEKGEDRLVAVQRAWPGGPTPGGGDGDAGLSSPGTPGTPLSNWFQSSHAGGPRVVYQLFAVFDGHNGPHAARYAVHAVVPTLERLLPPYLGEDSGLEEAAGWAAQLQEALVRTLLDLHLGYAGAGARGGCTATLVLQVGRLVTCAGVGTSMAVLDCGVGSVTVLAGDHRVEEAGERRRLMQAGAHIARTEIHGRGPAFHSSQGVGPVRLWPGGLTLSRSIGDYAVGNGVLPLPRIVQVMMPPTGGRIIVASDGVWRAAGADRQTFQHLLHSAPIQLCPYQVTQAISCQSSNTSDASIIVADAVAPDSSFPAVCAFLEAQLAAPAPSGTGTGQLKNRLLAGLSRLRKSSSTPNLQEAPPPSAVDSAAKPKLLTDVDVAALLGLVPGSKLELVPLWSTEQAGSEMLDLMREAWEAWHAARRRKEAAAQSRRPHRSAEGLTILGEGRRAADRLRPPCTARSKSVATRSCLKRPPSMGGSDDGGGGSGGGSSSDDATSGSKRVSFADEAGAGGAAHDGQSTLHSDMHLAPRSQGSGRSHASSPELDGVSRPPSPPPLTPGLPGSRQPPRLRVEARPSPNTSWRAAYTQAAGMFMSGAAASQRPRP